MSTEIKITFFRKRLLIEKGELTVSVDDVTEEAIQEKLNNRDFKTFRVLEQEQVTPDEWSFVPYVRNHDPGSNQPTLVA